MSEITEKEAEALVSFTPAITKDQFFEIDRVWTADPGINRRVVLGALSTSSEDLQKGCQETPETMFEAFECGVDYLNKLRDLEELMVAGCTRLMLSLCVLDWDSAPFTREQITSVYSQLEERSPTD